MSMVLGRTFSVEAYAGLFGILGHRLEQRLSVEGKKRDLEKFPLGVVKGAERFLGLAHVFFVLETGSDRVEGIDYEKRDSVEGWEANSFILENYEGIYGVSVDDFAQQEELIRRLIGTNKTLETLRDIPRSERARYIELKDLYLGMSASGWARRLERNLYSDEQ